MNVCKRDLCKNKNFEILVEVEKYIEVFMKENCAGAIAPENIEWIKKIIASLPFAQKAILISADGFLLLRHPREYKKDFDNKSFAAMTASQIAIAEEAYKLLGIGVPDCVIVKGKMSLISCKAGKENVLVVLTEQSPDDKMIEKTSEAAEKIDKLLG